MGRCCTKIQILPKYQAFLRQRKGDCSVERITMDRGLCTQALQF